MPTYEYACTACQHEFEAFQSIKDPPLTKCPSCGADQARRQISRGTGFILKGGGWYSDLYSSPSGGSKKPSEGGSGGSGSGGSSEGGGSGGSAGGGSAGGGSAGGGTSGGSTGGGGSSGGDSGGGGSSSAKSGTAA